MSVVQPKDVERKIRANARQFLNHLVEGVDVGEEELQEAEDAIVDEIISLVTSAEVKERILAADEEGEELSIEIHLSVGH